MKKTHKVRYNIKHTHVYVLNATKIIHLFPF